MSLINLKSIFTENIDSLANDFIDGAPTPVESIVVNMSSTYTDGIGGLFNKSTVYVSSKFTPMSSLNVPSIEQILTSGNIGDGITGGDGYPIQLSSYTNLIIPPPEPGNGISFKAAGEDLAAVTTQPVDGFRKLLSLVTEDRKFPNDTSWSNLYRADHKSKGVDGPQYSYGSNVNLQFGIRDEAPNITGISRTQLFGGPHGEPYIVSGLPDGDIGGLGGLGDGRLQNFASRSIPIVRAVTDTVRLTKYLTSPDGIAFIAKQNALGAVTKVQFRDGDKLMEGKQRFKEGYNPLSTLGASVSRLTGTTPNILFDREEPGLSSLFGRDRYGSVGLGPLRENVEYILDSTFTDGSSDSVAGSLFGQFTNKIRSAMSTALGRDVEIKPKSEGGDKMTLATMIRGTSLEPIGVLTTGLGHGKPNQLSFNVEKEQEGMPFYFKDLRDDTYIFFRAYIDGLTENISPSWASTNYLGRSEPVYVYERSERDISFNLKLFAQTEDELTSIYQKMNRLTSLCYPEYAKNTVGSTTSETGGTVFASNAMQRMKPPLTKFRLGELFGSEHAELTGFIKSLSYSYPSESPWETKAGKRVPKYVQVAISYQVIHMTVPSLDFAKTDPGGKYKDETFYGTNKVTGMGV